MIRLLPAATLTLALAAPLRGQEVSVFLGGAHARYADSLSGSTGVASARLRLGHSLSALDLEGGVAQFSTGERVVQGNAQGTFLLPVRRGVVAGVAGGGSTSGFQGGSWSGAVAAGPLVAVGTRHVVLAGASAGRMRTAAESTLGVVTASLRLRSPVATGWSLEVGGLHTSGGGVAYTDATAGLTVLGRAVRATLSVGTRQGGLAEQPWAQMRAEWAPWRGVALESAVGRYPRDLIGFSHGYFAQAGIRLLRGGSRAAAGVRADAVRVTRQDDRVRVLIRYVASDTALAIAGDFSDWELVPLERVAVDTWAFTGRLAPGVYYYALRAEGRWVLPEGVRGVDDGLGTTVGVLFVTR